jgi:thymidylate kinase
VIAPLIAVVGCDGSGKSTLTADLIAILRAERPVEACYLGLGSGAIGARIQSLPLIGAATERRLATKASRTRSSEERIPGLATALVVYGLSLLRRRRFRRVLALREAGVTVITDRYPQIEVAGFYDGPGLSAAQAGSPSVARLAARERRMYEWMAGYRPTLVIRLNVDLATAIARKPDHDPALLASKVAVTPQLRFGGAPIVDLDARAPYGQVRQGALDAIRAAIG